MAFKLTINLSDEVAETLKEMANSNDITVTEQVRRAISTEKWVGTIAANKHAKLLVEDSSGLKQVVFRP